MTLKRVYYKKYFFILLTLLFLFILPPFFTEGMRSLFLSTVTPLLKLGGFLQNPNNYELRSRRLETENQLLRTEIARLRSIIEQSQEVATYKKNGDQKNTLLYQLKKGVMAQVIYRDPASWSSSLWVDVGDETNQKVKFSLVQKNSPVLLGRYVVGAIDYVGKHHSRVRLITDSGLKVAVRAVRSGEKGDNYLAKGVILGGGEPLWRKNCLLKGIGFNYDFSDEMGAARDLEGKEPLIQPQDLLVTTGMDGLFPAGFLVALVTKLFPLKEGAFSYDIEAVPLAPKLEELKFLYIIPAQRLSIL